MNDPGLSPAAIVPFVILIFAIVFPLFWCGVIWLISQLSGWGWLAQRYRATVPSSGKVWTWQRGLVGWVGYNNVLTLTANAQGLFMETIWLFSFGHPRLFIPWQDFREAKVTHYFFQRQVKTMVGSPSMATLRLPAAIFEETEGRKVLQA